MMAQYLLIEIHHQQIIQQLISNHAIFLVRWIDCKDLRVISTLTHYSDIVSDISHIMWTYIYIWHIYSDILSGMYSEILPGILLAFYLAPILTFFLASSGIYSGTLSGIYSILTFCILSGSLSGILSDISSDILSGVLSGILSGMSSGPGAILGWRFGVWVQARCTLHSILGW